MKSTVPEVAPPESYGPLHLEHVTATGSLIMELMRLNGVVAPKELISPEYYDPSGNNLELPSSLFSDVLDVVEIGPREAPEGKFEQTWVVGGRGDTMLELAVLIEQSKNEADLGQIIYLAGMRPVSGVFDDRAAAYLHRMGEKMPIVTETDIADSIIRNVHGGTMVLQRSQSVRSISESPNNLGRRTFTDRLYQDLDGRVFALVNGAAVMRDHRKADGEPYESSHNRHTTRSVLSEVSELFPVSGRVLLMAAQPARTILEQVALDAAKGDIDSSVQFSPVHYLPPPEKLQPSLLLSQLAAVHLLSGRIAAESSDPMRYLDVVEESRKLGDCLQRTRQYLLHALASAGPYEVEAPDVEQYQPGKIFDAYIDAALGQGGQRRIDHAELFPNHPKSRAMVLKLLRELGMESREDTAITELDMGDYVFYSEGGTGLKMKKQLDLLPSNDDVQPKLIMIAGADWRQIPTGEDDHRGERQETAELLGIPKEDVGATEYDVAVQFARQIVDRSKELDMPYDYNPETRQITDISDEVNTGSSFRLIGYTDRNIPVVAMRQRRSVGSLGEHQQLGVGGSIEVVSRLVERDEVRGALGCGEIKALCFSTSALYAPTRRIAATISNHAAAKTQGDQDATILPTLVATYARKGDVGGPNSMRQAASETVALLNLIRDAG
jgi:hypothetical protein